jgi:hypothetical protein
MASCTLRTHLKGLLSINLVILLHNGENFLIREEDVFMPVLSVPLEETFVLVRRISFKAGVRRCPFERRGALMCRSPLMRHDLIGSLCSAFGAGSTVSRADFGESAPVLF